MRLSRAWVRLSAWGRGTGEKGTCFTLIAAVCSIVPDGVRRHFGWKAGAEAEASEAWELPHGAHHMRQWRGTWDTKEPPRLQTSTGETTMPSNGTYWVLLPVRCIRTSMRCSFLVILSAKRHRGEDRKQVQETCPVYVSAILLHVTAIRGSSIHTAAVHFPIFSCIFSLASSICKDTLQGTSFYSWSKCRSGHPTSLQTSHHTFLCYPT